MESTSDPIPITRKSGWQPVTSWDISISNSRKLIQFFIKPNLKVESKVIDYSSFPYLMRLPLGKEVKAEPRIDAQIRVFNRGHMRANDCRARLLFRNKQTMDTFPVECSWATTHEGEKSTSIAASLFPVVLNLFRLDPLTHTLTVFDNPTAFYTIPPGHYLLTLILDAEGTDSHEKDLGSVVFPDDVVESTKTGGMLTYKSMFGQFGYAVFLEKTSTRATVRIVGHLPPKRLRELQRTFKGFTFERV